MIAPVVVTGLSTSHCLSFPSSRNTRCAADDHGVDDHPELVDEIVFDQRLHQLRTADHVRVAGAQYPVSGTTEARYWTSPCNA